MACRQRIDTDGAIQLMLGIDSALVKEFTRYRAEWADAAGEDGTVPGVYNVWATSSLRCTSVPLSQPETKAIKASVRSADRLLRGDRPESRRLSAGGTIAR
jgi:hypothetical protein